jgi:diaminohydroxyphosphoribosylaminopyrimidine deaminase/5-amino-6-(5-phosphoribosylamino)uracil reductase
MAEALRLAQRGLYTADPNPRVGCVIVNGADVVGRGWHARTGGPHAEIVALRAAGAAAAGATAYVTLEPCCHHGRTPPCSDALSQAGIKRVVIGAVDANPEVDGGGQRALEAAGIVVDSGVLGAEARALNPGFFSRMTRGRPFVRSKLAVSLDGRTAMASGESKWITGQAAREDVQRWRARSAAILTGVGTILADDPSLNVRAEDLGEVEQPWRIIADSRLRTPADARTLSLPGEVLVFTGADDPDRRQALEAAGARVEQLAADRSGIALAQLMRRLGDLQINEVLVEAGPTLNGALLQAGLIDELVVFVASLVLGDAGRGMFALPGLERMAERVALDLTSMRRVGQDLRLVFSRS